MIIIIIIVPGTMCVLCLIITVRGAHKNIIIDNFNRRNIAKINMYKMRVVFVVAASVDLIDCKYRPTGQVIIIKVCMCSFVLCRTGFRIEIGHDPLTLWYTTACSTLGRNVTLFVLLYFLSL